MECMPGSERKNVCRFELRHRICHHHNHFFLLVMFLAQIFSCYSKSLSTQIQLSNREIYTLIKKKNSPFYVFFALLFFILFVCAYFSFLKALSHGDAMRRFVSASTHFYVSLVYIFNKLIFIFHILLI